MKKITVEDVSISYQLLESKDAAKIYIFLHGWGGSKKSFLPLAKQIHKKGHNALIFDFPGFGESENPPSDWNTIDYAKNFAVFLKAQKINKKTDIILYGHSFGCRVIVRYLTQLKFESNISEIFLTGAAGITLPLPLHKKIIKQLSQLAKPIKKIIPVKIQSLIRRKILRAHDWDAVNGVMKTTFLNVISEPDFRHDLSKISIPTNLIWGKKDTYTTLSAGKIFEKHLPNIKKFHIFPNGKHGIHNTHSKEIFDLISRHNSS